jgi:hypothetical protein
MTLITGVGFKKVDSGIRIAFVGDTASKTSWLWIGHPDEFVASKIVKHIIAYVGPILARGFLEPNRRAPTTNIPSIDALTLEAIIWTLVTVPLPFAAME